MKSISFLFKLLNSAVSIYEILCLIYVVMSWFPNTRNTRVGYFITQACEPFIGFFRRFNFRVGMLDFSPVLAFGSLVLISGVFSNIAAYGSIRLGTLLSSLLQVCWSLFSSVITVFNVLIVIRLVIHLAGKDFKLEISRTLDRIISPVQSRVSNLLFRSRFKTYRVQLACTLGICILIQILGSWITGFIATLLVKLPF